MEKPRIKAVIFDLDGTLVDTIYELANAGNYALTRLGCPTWTVADYRTFVGNGITRLLLRSLPEDRRGEIDTARAYFDEYYDRHILDTTPIYDGIPELLTELKRRGIRLAVNTNKAHPFAQRLTDYLFPGVFERTIGEKIGYPRKPEPDAALALAEMFGVSPAECIFAGDSGVDLNTAKNAGMVSVLCSWGFVYKSVLMEMDYENMIDRPLDMLKLDIMK